MLKLSKLDITITIFYVLSIILSLLKIYPLDDILLYICCSMLIAKGKIEQNKSIYYLGLIGLVLTIAFNLFIY